MPLAKPTPRYNEPQPTEAGKPGQKHVRRISMGARERFPDSDETEFQACLQRLNWERKKIKVE